MNHMYFTQLWSRVTAALSVNQWLPAENLQQFQGCWEEGHRQCYEVSVICHELAKTKKTPVQMSE